MLVVLGSFTVYVTLRYYRSSTNTAYLLIYVDDIVLTASFTSLLQRIISSLCMEFDTTDLRDFNYFMGTFSYTTSLVAYCDVDCAGYPSTRRSTSGYYVFFGDNLLSWSSKHQHPLSRSSVEVEYWGVANIVIEAASILTYFGNYTRLCYLLVLLTMTMHIRVLRVLHVPSRYQYAYISTKGLHSALFEEFRTILSVR
ncbi:ribonuclease H-like domain-containing protein [Tanacetum coccineum]